MLASMNFTMSSNGTITWKNCQPIAAIRNTFPQFHSQEKAEWILNSITHDQAYLNVRPTYTFGRKFGTSLGAILVQCISFILRAPNTLWLVTSGHWVYLWLRWALACTPSLHQTPPRYQLFSGPPLLTKKQAEPQHAHHVHQGHQETSGKAK